MPNNIALRNPQYKFIAIPSSGVLSVSCTITIEGTLRYTLIKNVSPSTGANFDISELARDYLNIAYSGTYAVQKLNIITVVSTHPSLNGAGTAVASITYTEVGYEAFGKFTEGSNPVPPYKSGAQFLIAPDTTAVHSSQRFQIFVLLIFPILFQKV